MEIGQDQIVTIRPDSVEVTDFDGAPVTTREFEIAWDASAAEKGGWPTFMKKEISEEPEAVGKTLLGRVVDGAVTLPELDDVADILAGVDRIVVLACGTAAYASMVGKYAIETWTRIPVDVELSHEFRYRDPVVGPNTLVVSVSQSGETMDTLMAVQYAKTKGARTLSICNTQGATIPRESDAVLYTHAGPEVAVASTKAFVAQITALYLLGLHLATIRGTLDAPAVAALTEELLNLPAKLDQVVESSGERIAEFAQWMGAVQSVLFLGRHAGYPIALEGALKLKELAYIHAEGFAAGELKHGPIALIEPGQLVIVVVPSPRDPNSLHPKVISNIQEIRARGARVIAVAEVGDVEVLPFADEVIRIPLAGPLFEPLLAVVPLHVFAMELATAKGLDVDQPRNLAKSVTVE
jgi:glucosamine--fructose-6-phosphate aminotransferase (isomerizing)